MILVLVLVVVLGGGQQAGDVADAFGDALPEKQLGSQSQVLGVFDEAEANHGSLACTQLILQHRVVVTYIPKSYFLCNPGNLSVWFIHHLFVQTNSYIN